MYANVFSGVFTCINRNQNAYINIVSSSWKLSALDDDDDVCAEGVVALSYEIFYGEIYTLFMLMGLDIRIMLQVLYGL